MHVIGLKVVHLVYILISLCFFAELASFRNLSQVIDFCTFAEDRSDNGSLGGALNHTDVYGKIHTSLSVCQPSELIYAQYEAEANRVGRRGATPNSFVAHSSPPACELTALQGAFTGSSGSLRMCE